MLIYPLKGRVLVGTTDLEHDMREPAVCTEEEVDYFFDLIAHVFPAIHGRPLADRLPLLRRAARCPATTTRSPGSSPATTASSEPTLAERPGTTLLSLVGGKWTTFRALAEHLSDEVLGSLGRDRVRLDEGPRDRRRRRLSRRPTTPGASGSRRTATRSGASAPTQLLERYGTRAEAYLGEIEGEQETPLAHHAGYSRTEIAWLVRTERVVHLADLVLRRTSIAFTGALTAPAARRARRRRRRGPGLERRASLATRSRRRATLVAERHGIRLAEGAAVGT